MTADLPAQLRERVRDIPDFPRPGVTFKDITPLLADPAAFAAAIDAIADGHGGGRIDKVVGIEARGFIVAAPVAYRLSAGLVPMRKQGKLPSRTFAASYELEYGDAVIEVHQDALAPGERVLIVDDVLATGGTVEAAAGLVRRAQAEVAGVSVLIELEFLGGRARLGDVDVHALLRY
jgi:adenine phosphoribosyltransferase